MIDAKYRYDFITKQLVYTNEKIIQAFTLFLKVTSVIIGGVAWLSIQEGAERMKTTFAPILPFLFFLVAVVSIILIITNLYSWWGFRKAESSLVGAEKIKPPRFPRSCIADLSMIATIIIATIAASLFVRF